MDDADLAHILGRCLAQGRETDWGTFVRLAQPVVASGILRSVARFGHVDRELVDDLIQETFLRLCVGDFRALREFRASNSNALQVYLRTIAASTAIDRFRSESAHKKGSGRGAESLDGVEGRVAAPQGQIEHVERRLLLKHVEKCLSSEEERARRIFWLYHLQELRPREISALPGIELSQGGVETILYRLSKAIRECLRRAGALHSAAIREGGSA